MGTPGAKPNQTLVKLSEVTLERDGLILDGVDWEIRSGENWAILGANGSGKTSLLRLVGRYQLSTSGTVFVLDDDGDFQGMRKRIGLVSASIAQLIEPVETAFEVVVSGREAMLNHWGEITAGERTAAHARLKQCEARHLADRGWGKLSQGERQRVLVARALMNPVEILLLDEPCAGLDPAARENFLGLLERISEKRGAPAILLVSHHVEEVTPVFTHALVLGRHGKPIASGPTDKVLSSKVLSEAFGTEVHLTRRGQRYRLEVARDDQRGF